MAESGVHALAFRPIRVETLNTLYVLGNRMSIELPADYREVLDEILGEDWQSVTFSPGGVMPPRARA